LLLGIPATQGSVGVLQTPETLEPGRG